MCPGIFGIEPTSKIHVTCPNPLDSCCLLVTRGHPRCYTILQISWLESERWPLPGDIEVESVMTHIFKSSLGLVYWAISGSVAGGWGRHLRACGICFTLKPYLSLSIKETGLCSKVSTAQSSGKARTRPGLLEEWEPDPLVRLIFLDCARWIPTSKSLCLLNNILNFLFSDFKSNTCSFYVIKKFRMDKVKSTNHPWSYNLVITTAAICYMYFWW